MDGSTAIVEQDTFVHDARDALRNLVLIVLVLVAFIVARSALDGGRGYLLLAMLVVALIVVGIQLLVEDLGALVRAARTDPRLLGAGTVSWDDGQLVIAHPVALRAPLCLPWSSIEVVAIDDAIWPLDGVFAVHADGTTRPLDQPSHLLQRPAIKGKRYPILDAINLADAWPNLLVVLREPMAIERAVRGIDQPTPRFIRGDLKLSWRRAEVRALTLRVADAERVAGSVKAAGVSDRIDNARWADWCTAP